MFYWSIFAIILIALVGWINFRLEKDRYKVLRYIFLVLVIVPCLINGCAVYRTETDSIRSSSDLYSSKADLEITKMKLSNASNNLGIIEKYEYVSRLNTKGSDQPFFYAINPSEPLIPKGLPEILVGSYESIDMGTQYKCDPISQEKFTKAISFNPNYPFSYYALAFCKRDGSGDEWMDYAKKAIEIFQITTQIEGHNSEHDNALEYITEFLSN